VFVDSEQKRREVHNIMPLNSINILW